METPTGSPIARTLLFVALGLFAVFYLYIFGRAIVRKRQEGTGDNTPSPLGLGIGFVTNFFDTLGIGSFATTTSFWRFFKMCPDEHIPGTLNVGHTIPTIAQAFIFTSIVPVETTTLVLMIVASVLGAWLGAGVVSRWPRRAIQIGMGVCLLGAAIVVASQAMNIMPSGGEAIGVTGVKLAIAVLGNFLLGGLMTLGIGLYAPCLVLVSLVGMNVRAAFPIMMGSCAFLMPIASARFVRTGKFDLKNAIALAIGGLPAVLLAAFIVKSLPLTLLRWVVVAVVLYTSFSLIRTAQRERAVKAAPIKASGD
jgi:uncharacterized membrane protein YfcA